MRLVGALVAFALLAAGFIFGRKLETDAIERNQASAHERADRSASAVADVLEKQLALFKYKANAAAQNPAVQALVRGGADEATVHDSLGTEAWAATFRERGGSAGLWAGGVKLGATASLLEPQVFEAAAKEAQANGESSVLAARQGVYLVAGAKLPFDSTDGRKVAVVLARPLGQEEVDALATVPVLVSDGHVKLAARGDTAALSALVGHESEGFARAGDAVAAVKRVGTLWVWVLQPVGAEVAPVLPVPAVWGASVALAALALGGTLLAGRGGQSRRSDTGSLPLPGATPSPLPRARVDGPAGAFAQTSPSMNNRSRYIEVAPLGEGGMARVSLAVTHGAEGFRRTFVVKRLKTELTVNPEIVAQFIDEARLGASLVHSNVIPVFDFGRDVEGYFIAQEYIMGRDLETVRRALFEQHRATLDVKLVLYVAQEALKALSYAHGKTDDAGRPLKLVHRDVSPNNLMVSARGEVKLLDFGIVKAEGKLSQTQTGTIKGNVFYMSPEQARGIEVDPRADLFSLGLVLYTLASAETLYRGTSNYDLLTRAGEGLSKPEWDRVARLPAPLPELLQRVLQFDPANRFASAEEFLRALPQEQGGSAADLQGLMDALFKDDFAAERARFSSIVAESSTQS